MAFFDIRPVYSVTANCDIPGHTDQYSCEQSGVWYEAKQERCTNSYWITKVQCEARANQWIERSDEAHCELYKGEGSRGERVDDSQDNCKCDLFHWCWPGDTKSWQLAYNEKYCSPNRNLANKSSCESARNGQWLAAESAKCSISTRTNKEDCQRSGVWTSGPSFCIDQTVCSKTFYFEGDSSFYQTISVARYCNTQACINRWIKGSSRRSDERAYCRKGICTSTFRYDQRVPPPQPKQETPTVTPQPIKEEAPPEPDLTQIKLPVLSTKKEAVITLAWPLGNYKTGAYSKYRISNYADGTLVGCETKDYSEVWKSNWPSDGATLIESTLEKNWGTTDCNLVYSASMKSSDTPVSGNDTRLADAPVPTVKEYSTSGPSTTLPQPPTGPGKVGKLPVGDGWAETSIKRAASNRLQTAFAVDGKATTRNEAIGKLDDISALNIVRLSKGVDFKMLNKTTAKAIIDLLR